MEQAFEGPKDMDQHKRVYEDNKMLVNILQFLFVNKVKRYL